MRRAWVILTVVGGIGLLGAIVLTVMEGVKYRMREDQGLDPILAPAWVAISSYLRLALFVLALVGLVVTGAIALARRRPRRAAFPSLDQTRMERAASVRSVPSG